MTTSRWQVSAIYNKVEPVLSSLTSELEAIHLTLTPLSITLTLSFIFQ